MPSNHALPNDTLNQGCFDPAPPMFGCYEYTRKPRRQLGSSDHIVLDQTGATKQLISRDSDECSRNLFDDHRRVQA